MKGKNAHLRISVHFQDREVNTLDLIPGDEESELWIGRDVDCHLKLPLDDRHASRRHARLYHDGKGWVAVPACERNPLVLNGREAARARLRPGQCLRLGQTFLRIHRGESQAAAGQQHSRLVLAQNTFKRGHQFFLEGERVTLGRHPEKAQILLKSKRISGVHAELASDDKGNWTIKLPRRNPNPTRVNGEKLSHQSRERLLNHNDIIELADVKMVFKDGRVKELRSNAIRTLCVMAAVLISLVGVYKTYRHFTPSAKIHLAEALGNASAEQFGPALEQLERAHHAKDAKAHTDAIHARRQQIESWQKTANDFRHFHRLMHAEDWSAALPFAAGLLNTRSISSWQWNGRAETKRREVEVAKHMLDALLNARGMMTQDDWNLERLQDAIDAGGEPLNFPDSDPAYAVSLGKDLQQAVRDLDRLSLTVRALERELAGLEVVLQEPPGYPDLEGIAARVTALVPQVHPTHRHRFRSYAEPLAGLAASYRVLIDIGAQARALEFNEALAAELKLPAEKNCAVDGRISMSRVFLQRNHERFKLQIATAAEMHRQVDRHARAGSQALADLQDPKQRTQLFACDSLNHPLPRRSSTDPSGTFDAMVGIREFHGYLKSLSDPNLAGMDRAPFPTVLRSAGAYLKAGQRFIDHYEVHPWLQSGAFKDVHQETVEALQRRDAIVTDMAGIAEAAEGRTRIIAAGITLQLGGDRDFRGESLRDWLTNVFRKNEAEVRGLYNAWRISDSFDEQIRLMDRILDTGLPGNGFVKEMWGKRMAEQRTAKKM